MSYQRLVILAVTTSVLFHSFTPAFAAEIKTAATHEERMAVSVMEDSNVSEEIDADLVKDTVKQKAIDADIVKDAVKQKEINTDIDEDIAKEKQKKQTSVAAYTRTDVRVLTAIVYCEAGYEAYEAKLGVANVVLNRVKSAVFDHVTTAKEVVYDLKRWGRQFSPAYVKNAQGKWTTKGSLLEAALTLIRSGEYTSDLQKRRMLECEQAAIEALEGKNNIGDYLYFNAQISATKERCKRNKKPYAVIDSTIFY